MEMIKLHNKINIKHLKKVNNSFGDKINKRIKMQIRKKEVILSFLSIIINQRKVSKFIKVKIKILEKSKKIVKQNYPDNYQKIQKMKQIFGKIYGTPCLKNQEYRM